MTETSRGQWQGGGTDWKNGMAIARISCGLLRLLKIALHGFSMPFSASLASTMVSNSTSTSLVPRTFCSTPLASDR